MSRQNSKTGPTYDPPISYLSFQKSITASKLVPRTHTDPETLDLWHLLVMAEQK